MKYKAQYGNNGVLSEKTPQQRKELAHIQFQELQDKRYQERKEMLDPKLYLQEFKYDPDSYFATPIFTDAQKQERSNMVSEIKDMTGSFGVMP
jgi:hypothetical protein